MSERAAERLARLKADVPVLPCWYCGGKDGDGEPYNPKVHTGWGCEACDERRATRAVVEAARTIRGCENFYEPTTCEDFREERDPPLCPQCRIRRALVAYDETNKKNQHLAGLQANEEEKS